MEEPYFSVEINGPYSENTRMTFQGYSLRLTKFLFDDIEYFSLTVLLFREVIG